MSTLENYKKSIDTKFTNLFSIRKILLTHNISSEKHSLLDTTYKTYMFKTVDIVTKIQEVISDAEIINNLEEK